MSVKILVNGQMKVVADVISPGVVAKIGAISFVYSGSDWLQCDGSAISRTTYSDLFAAIGTTFGSGDGVNTFNIPTQSQANRVTFTVAANQTFAQFTSDADIIVNNSSAASIDISNGAAGPGIRISIIEQSSQGVTIYTNAGHTQSYFLKKGPIQLEWDGTYWCWGNGDAPLQGIFFSTSGTWICPISGRYKITVEGGGGNSGSASRGGDTESGYYPGASGGGGAGGLAIKWYYIEAGTSCAYTAGAHSAASTFSDGTTTITGGAGAASGSAGATTSDGGSGGSATNGDINKTGQRGTAGFGVSQGGGGSLAAHGGVGGSGVYAAGGATGVVGNSSSSTPGLTGNPGIVIIGGQ